jgi:hypothetical protein
MSRKTSSFLLVFFFAYGLYFRVDWWVLVSFSILAMVMARCWVKQYRDRRPSKLVEVIFWMVCLVAAGVSILTLGISATGSLGMIFVSILSLNSQTDGVTR